MDTRLKNYIRNFGSTPPARTAVKLLSAALIILLLIAALASVILFYTPAVVTDAALFSPPSASAQAASPESVTTDTVIPDTNEDGGIVNTYGNTAGNALNHGYAAEQGNWIYYANQSDKSRIYKTHPDGTEKKRLTEHSGNSINVVGNTVYFLNSDGLWQVGTDGSGERLLINGRFEGLIVTGGYAYYIVLIEDPDEPGYIMSGGISKTELSTGETVIYSQDTMFENLVVIDGVIYYTGDNGALNKIDPDGSRIKTITYAGPGFCAVNDGFVYFENGGVYKASFDGTDKELLMSGTDPGAYNIADGVLYYCDQTDGYSLWRVGLDGSDKQRLDSSEVFSISIAGSWIYYYRVLSDGNTQFWRMTLDGTDQQLVD